MDKHGWLARLEKAYGVYLQLLVAALTVNCYIDEIFVNMLDIAKTSYNSGYCLSHLGIKPDSSESVNFMIKIGPQS